MDQEEILINFKPSIFAVDPLVWNPLKGQAVTSLAEGFGAKSDFQNVPGILIPNSNQKIQVIVSTLPKLLRLRAGADLPGTGNFFSLGQDIT